MGWIKVYRLSGIAFCPYDLTHDLVHYDDVPGKKLYYCKDCDLILQDDENE